MFFGLNIFQDFFYTIRLLKNFIFYIILLLKFANEMKFNINDKILQNCKLYDILNPIYSF